MGVIKGSIAYSKFYVTGELPDGFRDSFMQSICLRAFRPLTVEDEDEQRMGWSPIARPFESEVVFDYNDVFYNSYLNLALRTDAWRFPSQVFKAEFAEVEKKHLQERGREKLTKREKDELKFFVSRKLRKQFTPVMKVIDLSWNLESGVLRFWNQSTKAHESLIELFEKSFPMKLVPANPYTTSLHVGLPEARLEALFTVEPSVFHVTHH